MSAGGFSISAVIDSRYKPARQRETLGGSILRHDPNFSRKAAFLLDAMAAPPRKWVSGGAPPLPCIQERAVAASLSAPEGLHSGSHRQPLQTRAAARNPWRVDLQLDPFFSRKAAFLLDAMEAPPRKWVSGGAPPLPCIHERAVARLLIEVGTRHWFVSLPPPNRTCGSPASGSPVAILPTPLLPEFRWTPDQRL